MLCSKGTWKNDPGKSCALCFLGHEWSTSTRLEEQKWSLTPSRRTTSYKATRRCFCSLGSWKGPLESQLGLVSTHSLIFSPRAWDPRLLVVEEYVTAVPSHSLPPIQEARYPTEVKEKLLSKTYDSLPGTQDNMVYRKPGAVTEDTEHL